MQGELVGVMQLGYMLQPRRAHNIVAGTQIGEYLELNRMWLDDKAPRNSESRAISYAIKYIKKSMPMVAWIQSCADERCGRLGVVYQAANFIFCGSHKSMFYLLDDEYYHDMLMTLYRSKGRAQYLRDNRRRAKSLVFNQYRYIYFIKKAWQRRLLKSIQPYPKPEK